MSAVSTHVPDPLPGERPAAARKDLPRAARAYLLLVAAATAALAVGPLSQLGLDTDGWPAFFVFATGAAVAQLFFVYTGRDQGFHSALAFTVGAAFVLPPELLVLLVVAQHVPDWLKERYRWYIQSFNICNYAVSALAASASVHALAPAGPLDDRGGWALAALVACIVFVGVNHILLAPMLRLARGLTLRETGLFTVTSLSTDMVLAAIGVALASSWLTNPLLVPAVIAPLVLIKRSFAVLSLLQEEARVEPKTGLFNARHFAKQLKDELERSMRFQRPLSVIMADLDLLRGVNNAYGHLAGDAVLGGVASIFRDHLRPYDVPARFGGEEFAILLPETSGAEAFEIAERIRRAVAAAEFEVETSERPLTATISVGVASFPDEETDPKLLIHRADLAVYRAKLLGRNRVFHAAREEADPGERHLVAIDGGARAAGARSPATAVPAEPAALRPRVVRPHFLTISRMLAVFVALVSVGGLLPGVAGVIGGHSTDLLGLLALVGLVGAAQALAFELDGGSISVSAVGAIAGAAVFDVRAALPLALAAAAVEWSFRRNRAHHLAFNAGMLTLAALAAAFVFGEGARLAPAHPLTTAALGGIAGAAYFLVNTGLLGVAISLEAQQRYLALWRERFLWLLPHYVAFGIVGGAIAIGYETIGMYALAVFALPLVVTRKTMADYLGQTLTSARKLREAADTIQAQNHSLEEANERLKERSTAAMEGLAATVDARDAYTAGHSRRVQRLALKMGCALALSPQELEVLGQAALFHDIGKLAVTDAILLKRGKLTGEEWAVMRRHAAEGARIIERLGFLEAAVPMIRHHHESFVGGGYPDGLAGEEIPLGARVVHVADALDSMITTRNYRPALTLPDALAEIRRGAGTQFCPRCVAALDEVAESGELDETGYAPAEARAAAAAMLASASRAGGG